MRYICSICGYVYDDAKEKVPFEQLPADWRCPLCGAMKSDFKPEAVKENKPLHAIDTPSELKELNVGELSALCSNLARGCEKQYKSEESKLFQQLADYFNAVAPKQDNAKVEKVLEALQKDCEDYANLRAIADANGDRGAARVCVWGEKVTRMLSSLVGRYLNEGEKMLADTNIWVCTVCGFVYVGENPPELCPVCKVPSWKFEKVEGGNAK